MLPSPLLRVGLLLLLRFSSPLLSGLILPVLPEPVTRLDGLTAPSLVDHTSLSLVEMASDSQELPSPIFGGMYVTRILFW
jgi:hypothetical protein